MVTVGINISNAIPICFRHISLTLENFNTQSPYLSILIFDCIYSDFFRFFLNIIALSNSFHFKRTFRVSEHDRNFPTRLGQQSLNIDNQYVVVTITWPIIKKYG